MDEGVEIILRSRGRRCDANQRDPSHDSGDAMVLADQHSAMDKTNKRFFALFHACKDIERQNQPSSHPQRQISRYILMFRT
jgi:hypothetical protein